MNSDYGDSWTDPLSSIWDVWGPYPGATSNEAIFFNVAMYVPGLSLITGTAKIMGGMIGETGGLDDTLAFKASWIGRGAIELAGAGILCAPVDIALYVLRKKAMKQRTGLTFDTAHKKHPCLNRIRDHYFNKSVKVT